MKPKGFILITTIALMAILLLFGLSYHAFYLGDKGQSLAARRKILAKGAAAAAVDLAIYELKNAADPATWTTGVSGSLTHSGTSYSVSFSGATPSRNNISGGSAVTAYDGRSIPAGCIYLVGVGTCGSSTQLERAIIKYASTTGPFLEASFAGKTTGYPSTLVNCSFDSWDSSLGTYAATQQNSGADVGTNCATAGGITLSSALVYGNAIMGPGSLESYVTKGGVSSYLGFSALSSRRSLPLVTPPEGCTLRTVPADAATINLSPGVYYDELNYQTSGRTYTVNFTSGGNYVFNCNFTILGNGVTFNNVSGNPIVIYLMSNLSISSQPGYASYINNNTQDPKKFVIVGGSGTTNIYVTGNAPWTGYFSVYAPTCNICFSGTQNSDFYGSFVGDSMMISGGATTRMHYDRSLKNYVMGTGYVAPTITLQSRWW